MTAPGGCQPDPIDRNGGARQLSTLGRCSAQEDDGTRRICSVMVSDGAAGAVSHPEETAGNPGTMAAGNEPWWQEEDTPDRFQRPRRSCSEEEPATEENFLMKKEERSTATKCKKIVGREKKP
jgi:hypothetical protein